MHSNVLQLSFFYPEILGLSLIKEQNFIFISNNKLSTLLHKEIAAKSVRICFLSILGVNSTGSERFKGLNDHLCSCAEKIQVGVILIINQT